MLNYIKTEIHKTGSVIQKIGESPALLETLQAMAQCCISALRNNGKILFAGNGGSAADAQHLAAELVCRFSYDRPALAAIALTTDTSALTAIGNDYSFDHLFSRQVEAMGQAGDVLVVLSTSGRSPNILKALDAARSKKMTTMGLTGESAPLLIERCDFLFNVPSLETPKIQECHAMVGHIICALIEESIYGRQYNPLKNQVALSEI